MTGFGGLNIANVGELKPSQVLQLQHINPKVSTVYTDPTKCIIFVL